MTTYKCICGNTITDDNNFCKCGLTSDEVKAGVRSPSENSEMTDEENNVELLVNEYGIDQDDAQRIVDEGYYDNVQDTMFIESDGEVHPCDDEDDLKGDLLSHSVGGFDQPEYIFLNGVRMQSEVAVKLSTY